MPWQNAASLNVKKYNCGLCGELVASNVGFYDHAIPNKPKQIYICPNCNQPSYFGPQQVPGPVAGNKVDHLPKEIDAIYLEARNCVSVGAHTAAVLACRKLLMHVAV